jgi:multidrug efflux pump subunit AcrA (membrane-fusion protein)
MHSETIRIQLYVPQDEVAVVEDGIARIRTINVVRDFGTTVEVNAGVKDGDQVILNPPVDLIDGRKVKVRPGPPGQLS